MFLIWVLFLFIFFIFGPLTLSEGPMSSALSIYASVRLSNCPSVHFPICNIIFSGLAHYFFLIFCMKLGFNKYIKRTEPILAENSYYLQHGLHGTFSDPKSIFLNFSLNFFIIFFWNCTWWKAFKNGYKRLFWIFKESFYYVQIGGNGLYLD